MISSGYQLHLLRGEVGQGPFEGSFVEICLLMRPTVQIGYFDLSLLVDKDVVGSDVSDFAL